MKKTTIPNLQKPRIDPIITNNTSLHPNQHPFYPNQLTRQDTSSLPNTYYHQSHPKSTHHSKSHHSNSLTSNLYDPTKNSPTLFLQNPYSQQHNRHPNYQQNYTFHHKNPKIINDKNNITIQSNLNQKHKIISQNYFGEKNKYFYKMKKQFKDKDKKYNGSLEKYNGQLQFKKHSHSFTKNSKHSSSLHNNKQLINQSILQNLIFNQELIHSSSLLKFSPKHHSLSQIHQHNLDHKNSFSEITLQPPLIVQNKLTHQTNSLENQMALKIQTAWKKYKTSLLVKKYQNMKSITKKTNKFYSFFNQCKKLPTQQQRSKKTHLKNNQPNHLFKKQQNIQINKQQKIQQSIESSSFNSSLVTIDQSINSTFYNKNYHAIKQQLKAIKKTILNIRNKDLNQIQQKYNNQQIKKDHFERKSKKIIHNSNMKIGQIKDTLSILKNAFRNANIILKKQQKTNHFHKLHSLQNNLKLKKCISSSFLDQKTMNYLLFMEQSHQLPNPFPMIKKKSSIQQTQNNESQQEHDQAQHIRNQFLNIDKNIKNEQSQLQEGIVINFKNNLQKNSIEQCINIAKQNKTQKNNYNNHENAKQIKLFKKDTPRSQLNPQKKESIFQYLFLDLIQQLIVQISTQIIMNQKIYNFFQANKQLSYNKLKGIQYGIQYIIRYLQNIQTLIISKYQQNLTMLQIPCGPSPYQMLKYMRQFQQIEVDNSVILTREIYQAHQKQLDNLIKIYKCYLDAQKQKKWQLIIKNLHHIYNKAIFDSLNQMLDYQRPYGIWGIPFPWKCSIKSKKNRSELKTLQKACNKIIKASSMMCGYIIGKPQVPLSVKIINKNLVDNLKQEKIIELVSLDIIESQKLFTFYDDQQLQILIDISIQIFQQIICEAINDCLTIKIP